MTHNAKSVGRIFRQHGAHRGIPSSDGTEWVFPDGARRFVPANISNSSSAGMVQWAAERYGRLDKGSLVKRRKITGAPRIDLTRTTATDHAKERLELMRAQLEYGDRELTMREVVMALTCPVRVRWDDRHGSYLWEGERVAVAANVTDDGHTVIKTILWTTTELWDANPRPEHAQGRR